MFKEERNEKPHGFIRVAIFVTGLLLSSVPYLFPTAVVYSSAGEPQRRTGDSPPGETLGALPRIDYFAVFSCHSRHDQKLGLRFLSQVSDEELEGSTQGRRSFSGCRGVSGTLGLSRMPSHQFFARERPAPAICSNCHVKVTPQDTARFLFPSLGDITDSTVGFASPFRNLGWVFRTTSIWTWSEFIRPGFKPIRRCAFVIDVAEPWKTGRSRRINQRRAPSVTRPISRKDLPVKSM